MKTRTASPRSNRSGIILLVVLGMLGLFSLLAVSYVVFASRARASAAAVVNQQRKISDPHLLLEKAQQQVLRGGDVNQSPLGPHSLLGDYYGFRDSVNGRIRDAGLLTPLVPSSGMTSPNTAYVSSNERQLPSGTGQCFTYLDGQFLRVPTNLADSISGNPAIWPTDDLGNGRVLTMTDGPLENVSFEIIKSFGNMGNAPAVSGLTGAVILDLTPHLPRTISHLGQTRTLEEWVRTNEVLTLFYWEGGDALWGSTSPSNRINAGAPQSDDIGYPFVVGGYPQNGSGMGVTGPTPIKMDDMIESFPVANDSLNRRFVPKALQGNYAMYPQPASGVSVLPNGDTDEPYDAPDYQNLHLAYFPADPELGAPSPSYIRPALINYFANTWDTDIMSLNPSNADDLAKLRALVRILQRSTLRPLPVIDPTINTVQRYDWRNFTGSNPNLSTQIDLSAPTPAAIVALARTLAVGPWDVDNDGDGINDSVWVDAGLPAITMPDGRMVKPLVAVRIEDLGGRVDVNAAGSLAYFVNAASLLASGGLARNNGTGAVEGIAPNDFKMEATRGLGVGPADMTLRTMFSGTHANGLSIGRELLLRRYGVEKLDIVPGKALDVLINNGNDLMGLFRDPYRPNYHQAMNNRRAPLDAWGRGKVVLDVYGQPLISNVSMQFADSINWNGQTAPPSGVALFDETINDPYELISRASGLPDAAYTIEELEALLRSSDPSHTILEGRLAELVDAEVRAEANAMGVNLNNPSSDLVWKRIYRNLAAQITVYSRALATPSASSLPLEMRADINTTNAPPQTSQPLWTEELQYPSRITPIRGFQRAFTGPGNSALDDWKRFQQVIPPEVRAGFKFNLNRPFGNDVDDNGNGVADESSETNPSNVQTLITVPNQNKPTFSVIPVSADFTPEKLPMESGNGLPGKLNLQGNDARQLYARHLFCLMLFNSRNHANDDMLKMPLVDPQGGSNVDEDKLTRRKLAQWAVNAVDFRDADGIMTGFEFDGDPFDGWDVDGDLTTDETASGVERGIVWGMESPALLLTEGFALHDRRTRDTAEDASGKKREPGPGEQWANMDDDVDQYRIPFGALYLELFCPRPASFYVNATGQGDHRANPWGASPDLYTIVGDGSGNQFQHAALDLDRLAPDNNPVWRIGISRAHNADNPDNNAKHQSPLNRMTGANGVDRSRDTFTGQPEHLVLEEGAVPNFQFDRVIWLTSKFAPVPNGAPMNTPAALSIASVPLPADTVPGTIYYNRFVPTLYQSQPNVATQGVKLRGGQYAVIGPRALPEAAGTSFTQIPIGSQTNPAPTGIPYAQFVSPQQYSLSPTQFTMKDLMGTVVTPSYGGGNPVTGAQIREIVGIGAAADAPPTWAGTAEVGVNISAPNPLASGYYQQPTYALESGYPLDSYYDYQALQGQLPDEPFDLKPYAPLANDFPTPEDGQRTGTRNDYKTAYLQRLADPTQAFHPLQNPYITVDWISLDLTVFNGEDSNKEVADSAPVPVLQWVDQNDPDPFGNGGLREQFGSRYKSGQLTEILGNNALPIQSNSANLFSYHTQPPVNTSTDPGSTCYFPIAFNHDLDINAGGVEANHSTTLGYLNHSLGMRWSPLIAGGDERDLAYIGAPAQKQFMWLAWLDRPYASPLELMLVPFTTPARLGLETSIPSQTNNLYPTGASGGTGPGPNNAGKPFDGTEEWNYRSEYQYLLNFFSSGTDFKKTANFHRLLEWVETPEAYDEAYSVNMAERFPTRPMPIGGGAAVGWRLETATAADPDWATTWNIDLPLEGIRHPFNSIPSRQRRGLVNLNTINGNRVYRELMDGYSRSNEVSFPTSATDAKGALWDEFIASRRGYEMPNSNVSNVYPYRFDPRFDPEFPTDVAGAFRPAANADLAPPVRGSSAARPWWPNNVPSDYLSFPEVQSGLLRQMPGLSAKNPQQRELPLFLRDPQDNSVPQNHQHRDLSSFHRYQGMTRLANMTTGRSNVYAVWITLGYFELDVDTQQVGQEYGFEDGTNQRHRSFMVIDRSIPVRFEPGKDHNTSDVILLQRFLN